MDTDLVPETSEHLHSLTRLSAREDFTERQKLLSEYCHPVKNTRDSKDKDKYHCGEEGQTWETWVHTVDWMDWPLSISTAKLRSMQKKS
jgi:hypothetical protein